MTTPFHQPRRSDGDIASADLEKVGSLLSPTTSPTQTIFNPVLGRRKSSTGLIPDVDGAIYDGDEDTLTKIGNALDRVHSFSVVTRYALYILPVASALVVPLVLCDTVYREARAGGIRLLGLFVWLEVIWVALWICKLIALAAPIVFQVLCGLISTGVRKYSLVLMALEVPLSLLLWTVVAYVSAPLICVFEDGGCGRGWVKTLETVLKAGIIVASIYLAEKALVQLVSIEYHRKQYAARIREDKHSIRQLDLLYNASRTLFPEFCREFRNEDADIQGNTLADVRSSLAKVGVPKKVVSNIGRVRHKMTAAFGAMASDISGKHVLNTNSARSIVIGALETERGSKALARRLWASFVLQGNHVLYKEDLIEVLGQKRGLEIDEIFVSLDGDANGDVSLDDMTMLVTRISQERRNRMTSMQDISEAIAVLDRLLCAVVLVAIAFIYAAFFSKTFAAKTSQLWTSVAGLAFASGGTVTEFISCCIFIFVKHPYDVGDRVDIKEIELVVEHISLTYSVFRRVDSDKTVQVPHSIASTMWIENVTRSKNMKERLCLNVAVTTTTSEILQLKAELSKFITSSENKRDFQPDIDIELRGVGDMKHLELRVEIRHKSNFANEQLRNARRNRFMCELLSAVRRIPIEPPGGVAAPLGDQTNPAYNVTISHETGKTLREKATAETSAKFPTLRRKKAVQFEAVEGLAIQTPVVRASQAMISGIESGKYGNASDDATGKRGTPERIAWETRYRSG